MVYKLINRTDMPGYGCQIEQGATALTEAWDGRRVVSHNHCMLGHVQDWFHHDLLGIGLDPQDVMATYNLGLAYLKQGNRDKALELFLAAHELDGDHPDIACHIGLCYQEMAQTDKALEFLEPAAQKAPKSGPVFRALGDCYLSKEKLRKATKAYERAIRANPKDAKSLSALGYLYAEVGENLEIAIVLARESTSIDPENGLYRLRLGKLYLRNGEPKKALQEFEQAQAQGQDCKSLIEKTKSTTDIVQTGNAA